MQAMSEKSRHRRILLSWITAENPAVPAEQEANHDVHSAMSDS